MFKTKLIFRVTLLILFCTIVQLGPLFLGNIVQQPVEFVRDGNHPEINADISNLAPGEYYLSLGHILLDTEVLVDTQRVQKDILSLGTPITLIGNHQNKTLTIRWEYNDTWRNKLYDKPFLATKAIGWTIQAWRSFVSQYLGMLASFILIVTALINIHLQKKNKKHLDPFLTFGICTFFYGLYVSGIPDIFHNHHYNTFIQIILRTLVSLSYLYLVHMHCMPKHISILLPWIFAIHISHSPPIFS